MKPKISIIIGSIREGRNGEAVAKSFYSVAKLRQDMAVELVDLLDFTTPQSDSLSSWEEQIASSDGFVFVVPEYNHGYPACLKQAIDSLGRPWHRKAAAFVSYGGVAGGARAVEQLRLVLAELHVATIRTAMLLPNIKELVVSRALSVDPSSFALRANTLLDDLLWWTNALKLARN